MLDAVIFDFDGLILDTETPLYTAWHQTFEHYGVEPIGLTEWSASLGLADDDPRMLNPLDRLQAHLGKRLQEAEVQTIRRRFRDGLLDHLPIQPGVMGLLDEARAAGVPVGIASSSPREWIDRHLKPRGILGRFNVISCAGNGVPGKPDPTVYRVACEALGAAPDRTVAFEDSPNGALAAKAAGLACVAVPTPVSEALDFSHADATVSSLEEIRLQSAMEFVTKDPPRD